MQHGLQEEGLHKAHLPPHKEVKGDGEGVGGVGGAGAGAGGGGFMERYAGNKSPLKRVQDMLSRGGGVCAGGREQKKVGAPVGMCVCVCVCACM